MSDFDVRAILRYLVPDGTRPIYIASQAGADAALNIGAEFADHEVLISDARKKDTAPTLEREGFTLLAHHTGVTNFYNLAAEQAHYEQEITELVLSATGAEQALVFDHTLRSDSRDIRGQRTTREPATVIHNDYTDASAEKRLRDLVSPETAQARLSRRFAIVNVWRSIRGRVFNSPLACCDAKSTAPADLVPSERRAQERIGELELVSWNPDHRWYYYPAMVPGEALLLKTYDSSRDGRARRSVHSAFENPLAPADAPPRESLESRIMVFF